MKDVRHILGMLKRPLSPPKYLHRLRVFWEKKDFPVPVKWMSIFEGFAFFGNSTIVHLRENCVLLSAKLHPLETIVTYLAWIKL